MIRAKCEWVYPVPSINTRPGSFSASRAARSLLRPLWRESVQKRFGQRTLRRNNESKKSCDHPNRLNLLTLTMGRTVCSNFLREIRVWR